MSRFRTTTLATALVMLLAALAAGCGGGSSDSDSTAADRDANTTQQRPGSEQQAELRECLEKNGADLPSPPEGGQGGPPEGGGMPPIGGGQGGPPGGGDPSEFRDALEKCGVDPSDLPNRPGGRGRPPMGESLDDFVACVRKNGYDLPDPDTSGDGPVFDPSKVDQDDPDFKKASQACQDKLRPSSPPDSSDSNAG